MAAVLLCNPRRVIDCSVAGAHARPPPRAAADADPTGRADGAHRQPAGRGDDRPDDAVHAAGLRPRRKVERCREVDAVGALVLHELLRDAAQRRLRIRVVREGDERGRAERAEPEIRRRRRALVARDHLRRAARAVGDVDRMHARVVAQIRGVRLVAALDWNYELCASTVGERHGYDRPAQ